MIDYKELFTQLISLFDDEKLIRFGRRAEKKGFEELEKILKEHHKQLEKADKKRVT
jgi:hypothetical protein